MKRLTRLVQSATPTTAVQFRKHAYGKDGVQTFLRDVLAMANAAVAGSRYIVTGAEFDARGRKRLFGVGQEDFSGKPAYQSLANEFIEPPIRIRYEPVTIEGERIGVYEIGDCQDRPYMMRIDFSESLRRGDAYARLNDSVVKLGRRQLQTLFEKKFRHSVSATNIEIGFPGHIIHKDRKLATCSLARLPSAIAGAKLRELIEVKTRVQTSATNTAVARLTHARVFGTDRPYEKRSTDDIRQELRQIERQYRNHDQHFLFTENGCDLQLVVLNQADEKLNDASMTFTLPTHDAFCVASQLPKLPRDDCYVDRTPTELADYPSVTAGDGAYNISVKLGDVSPGEPIEVFKTPLRLCAGTDLVGRRIGIQYSLFAQNLRSAATGKLRLLF